MGVGTAFVLILVLLLVDVLPIWRHSRGMSYVPAGVVSASLLGVVSLIVTGQL
ncbi:DUF3309 family protein [Devosia sediminis]|uniref:DUF3309 family protein n=1 Tax=Devosia sediminis TaxID=2798801 RepID=A0A934MKD7_9HYPH|nr:DUF3309 family protein [Devosia sediminis]